jgi:glycosyltransferase involved in cell wall biosynthesis
MFEMWEKQKKNKKNVYLNKQIKILYLITTLDLGGAERHLLELCRSIGSNKNVSSQVVFLKGSGSLAEEFEDLGIAVLKCPSINFFVQVTFLVKLSRNKVDIIHAHLPKAELIGFVVARLNRLRLTVTRHNCEEFWMKSPRLLSKTMSKIICSKSSSIVAISNSVQEFLIANNQVTNKQRGKIRQIYYGFDDTTMQKKEMRLLVKNEKIQIGTIARLEPQKDIETFLMAMHLLKSNGQDFQGRILGEGRLLHDLQKMTDSLGLENSIRFEGKSESVDDFLDSLDLFVLTSQYEGFGVVLIEAMRRGVPILASRTTSIPEVMGERYPGLFKVGDESEIVDLILRSRNKDFRNELCQVYTERLNRFCASRMGERHMNLYQEIIL